MTDKLPDPLVPQHVDISTYEWMPLYGDRLKESDHNSCTDSEFRASINLWWSAWKQVPAGSLPNDDKVLCKAADLGRDVRAWMKVKAVALRHFVLCSDGRLYHRVLGPLAIEAFKHKAVNSTRAQAGAAARWKNHTKKNKRSEDAPVDGNARAVDNNAPSRRDKSSEHQDALRQASFHDAPSTDFDAQRQKFSQPVSQLEPPDPSAVDNPQTLEGNSKSKQEATANGERRRQAVYDITAVPEPLRKFIPPHLQKDPKG
jgi:hypothetical protein